MHAHNAEHWKSKSQVQGLLAGAKRGEALSCHLDVWEQFTDAVLSGPGWSQGRLGPRVPPTPDHGLMLGADTLNVVSKQQDLLKLASHEAGTKTRQENKHQTRSTRLAGFTGSTLNQPQGGFILFCFKGRTTETDIFLAASPLPKEPQ